MSFVKHYDEFINENLNNKFELLFEKKLIKGYDPEKYVYFNVLPVKLSDYFDENWYNKSEVGFASPNENDDSDVYNRMTKEDFKKFKDAAEKKGFDLENKEGKLETISYFEPKK
jgi:hypothetical protein